MATVTCRLYRGRIFTAETYEGHTGQDITALEDFRILSLLEGVVTYVWTNTDYAGYGVEITTTQNTFNGTNVFDTKVWYWHMATMPYVRLNDQVYIATVLGLMGETGNTTGPHCHVEWVAANGVSDLDEPFLTGVPWQPIGSGGAYFDNDYDPDEPGPGPGPQPGDYIPSFFTGYKPYNRRSILRRKGRY